MSGTPRKRWESRYYFRADTPDQVCRALANDCYSAIYQNYDLMQLHDFPCSLVGAGIKYVDPQACSAVAHSGPCQTKRLAPDILEQGVATCIDVVCYYIPILWRQGHTAWPVFIPTKVPGLFHGLVEVETPQGVVRRDYTRDLIQPGPTAFAVCSGGY